MTGHCIPATEIIGTGILVESPASERRVELR